MFRKNVACVLLSMAAGLLFAAESTTTELDTSLLDKAKAESYINDNSPVAWKNYNSGKQIRDMGRRLGAEIRYQEQVNKAESPYASGAPNFKYKVVRIYPGTKAGADVIYIGKNARVGTIKNMRRIVSGYVEKAYDIPMDKADEIAVKVCYWNTNHYDDRAYFTANFQHRVVEVFANRTKIMGLARSYKNWPGKTRLVIPFVLIKETVPDAVEPTAPQPEQDQAQVVTPQPDLQPETDVAPEPAETEKGGLPMAVIILLIVIGVALVVLAVVLIKMAVNKKNNENGNSDI